MAYSLLNTISHSQTTRNVLKHDCAVKLSMQTGNQIQEIVHDKSYTCMVAKLNYLRNGFSLQGKHVNHNGLENNTVLPLRLENRDIFTVVMSK